MTEKQKILDICNDVYKQIKFIINNKLNSEELRSEYNIKVFTKKCPVCTVYLKNKNCSKYCIFNDYDNYSSFNYNCSNLKTRPKNIYSIKELKIRLEFWKRIISFMKRHDDNDTIFYLSNRSLLQKKFYRIDKKVYLKYRDNK